jgi:hypothetical protein
LSPEVVVARNRENERKKFKKLFEEEKNGKIIFNGKHFLLFLDSWKTL